MRRKVFFLGANFPLSARIADIVKRELDVIPYNFDATFESGHAKIAMAFKGDLFSSIVTGHGASYVLLTSESLLYIQSEETVTGLVGELRACKRVAGVHLAYVEIAEPIVVESGRVIRSLMDDSTYSNRLAVLREGLTGLAANVLQVQSIYSPENDVWGQNFLHLLFDVKGGKPVEVVKTSHRWEALSADEVALTLISNLDRMGPQQLSYGPFPGGLEAFCKAAAAEFVNWSNAQTSQSPTVNANERNAVPQKSEPSHSGLYAATRQAHCAVNYLYRKAPEDAFGLSTVAELRSALGKTLANSIPHEVVAEVDMIVPVPETGKIYAQGLATALGLPYMEGIYKIDRERSFDIENYDQRREFLFSRLNVVPGSLMGKIVLVVDEAIFTGATLKVVSYLLKQAGARRIYFAIPSPEVRYECKFNMQPNRNLLSEYVRKEDLWSYFDVQNVHFQENEAFVKAIDQHGPKCVACFIHRGVDD
jgi:hypoxanthine phosphoribosyltransferase